jgi:hypothetical protein
VCLTRERRKKVPLVPMALDDARKRRAPGLK